MIPAIAIFLIFGLSQSSDKSTQPRISATDTAYLGCTAWTGKGWSDPATRSSRTRVINSPKGFRAYAEVKATVFDGSCENTTTLYVASEGGGTYKVAYTIAPSTSNGNGIRLIGWSPNGDRLLAELNLWEYETDGGFSHVGLLYDASTGVVKEVHPDKALTRHFGPSCEFELSIESWRSDEQALIKVSKSPETESYVQHFCIKAPQKFAFDLQKETLQPELAERPKSK
jgi:hypothetical protein